MKWDLALSERFTRWKQYQLCCCSCFTLWVKCYDNTSETVGAEFIPRRENEIQTWQIRHKYKNKNNEHTKIITWSPEITSKACFIIIHNKNTLKHALLSSPVLMVPHKHWTDIVKTGSRSKHGSEWDISTQSGLLKGHRDTHTPLINTHSSSKVYYIKNHFVIASVVKVKKEGWSDSGLDDEVKI